MGNCVNSDEAVALRATVDVEDQNDLFSKSIAMPENGFTSPKARFKRRTSAHLGVMSSIAMKFPHIRRSYLAVKESFEKYADIDTDEFYISSDKIIDILIELGARRESCSPETVTNIIKIAKRKENNAYDKDAHLTFKEFLISTAIEIFLKANPEQESEKFLRIRKGFEAAQLAFSKIDRDDSGRIDFEELKQAFLAMKEDDFILERLKELDFNGDNTIEFPEFVWGISSWVGMDVDNDFFSPNAPLLHKSRTI
eukprot:501026_1